MNKTPQLATFGWKVGRMLSREDTPCKLSKVNLAVVGKSLIYFS